MNLIAPPNHTRRPKTTVDWITPKWLIDCLGPFDLDPCACQSQPWPCARESYFENGLLLPWHGLVWLNPPYGRVMGDWLNRLALHGTGIALVFARTDTQAFHNHVWPYASTMLMLRGRLTFHRPSGKPAPYNSGGPSVLIAYGAVATKRIEDCADLGAIVYPRRAYSDAPLLAQEKSDG